MKEFEERNICLWGLTCRTTPEVFRDALQEGKSFNSEKKHKAFNFCQVLILRVDINLKTSWENSAELHVSSRTRTLDIWWASAGVKKTDEGSDVCSLTHTRYFQTLWNDLEEMYLTVLSQKRKHLCGRGDDPRMSPGWRTCGRIKPVAPLNPPERATAPGKSKWYVLLEV